MNCPNHPSVLALRVCPECGGQFCNSCAPLKQGKTLCKNCKEEIAIIKGRQGGDEAVPSEDGDSQKGKHVQSNRIGNLIKSAEAKVKHLASVRVCGKHQEVEAVAACCRCKKNLCEKCIAFEHKDDLICQECWAKIPLSLRLSRKSKGHW